jgi:hypothetical protein
VRQVNATIKTNTRNNIYIPFEAGQMGYGILWAVLKKIEEKFRHGARRNGGAGIKSGARSGIAGLSNSESRS